ncbi:type III effector protein, partial [Streptomyces sp. T21Q-yed]|nr:type III effector protein [Streptomyces sp. T21Q-yed]
MAAADQPASAHAGSQSPASFLAAAAALEAIGDALRAAQHEAPGLTDAENADPEQALASLLLLRQIREQLAGWETGLIE